MPLWGVRYASWSVYMRFNNRNLKLAFLTTRCIYWEVRSALDLPVWAFTIEIFNCHSLPLDASTGGAFQPYKLPILTSQLHLAQRATPNMVSHTHLIFRNTWDIKHFLFFLTFSYHWEILYEPHCQQCWVKFTHAGHIILQLILYKLWSKTLLWAFQLYKLPILTSQLHPAQRATHKYGVTPLPYLYK